ncbi:MAG: DUF4258 domain-containing protein [bacterium]
MRPELTQHARKEAERRGIAPEWIEETLAGPEQIVDASGGRKAYQSRFDRDGRVCLLRAIVEEKRGQQVVVTVYRTSKVEKYWRFE